MYVSFRFVVWERIFSNSASEILLSVNAFEIMLRIELSCSSIKVFCFSCLWILLKRNFSITFRKIEALPKNTFNPRKTFPEIVPMILRNLTKTQRSGETYKTEKSKGNQKLKSSASNDIFFIIAECLSLRMESILDENVPQINTSILQPSQPSKYVRTPKSSTKSGFKRFNEWLLRFVPTPVKRPINKEFEAFKKKVVSWYPKQLKFEESKRSALKGFAVHHSIKPPKDEKFDPKTFLMTVKQKAMEKLKPQTKVRLVLIARMERILPTTNGESIIEMKNFQSKTMIILPSTDLNELWTEMTEIILENIAVFQMIGSGWTFHSIVSLDIHTARYKPLRGGTYVKLPKYLASKKALINMKFRNENKTDNQCFKWWVARALNPATDHPERITKQLKE